MHTPDWTLDHIMLATDSELVQQISTETDPEHLEELRAALSLRLAIHFATNPTDERN